MAAPTKGPRSPNPVINRMSSAERQQYMTQLGAKAHADRLMLSGDEARALADVYKLIDKICARHHEKLDRLATAEDRGRDG